MSRTQRASVRVRNGFVALCAVSGMIGISLVLSFTAGRLNAVQAAARITPPPTIAAPTFQLSVYPTHGLTGATFEALYAVTPTCPGEARFFFDGNQVAAGTFDGRCQAYASLTPGSTAAVGPHTVGAWQCIGGSCDPNSKVLATYVIDAPPTPTPTATPTPVTTPKPTPKPTAAPTHSPTPTPVPTAKQVPTPTPKPTDTPGPAPTATTLAAPTPVATATPAPTATAPTPAPSVAPATPAPTPAATPAPTASATVEATPEITASPPPTPTPTETPAPTLSPTPTPVASAAVVPVLTPGPEVTPVPTVASPAPARQIDALPAFAQSVPGPDGLDLDLNVVLTNILLTLAVVILFGLTSAVFNSTIDDNRDDIAGAMSRFGAKIGFITAPLMALNRAAKSATDRAGLSAAGRVVVVLLLTGLIYGFLSPDFGLNSQSLFLFIALVIGLGFGTYLQEGGSTLLAVRRYHVDSSVRLFGAGIFVAIVCVLASRVAGLQPGFVYGFIASSVILAPVALDRRSSANLVILPSLALLGASMLAWIAMGPLHAAAVKDGSALNVLLDTIAAAIFVGGLEGVFYSMIPLTFMDGVVVWRWNRIAWVAIFGVTTFLFWQLVINQYSAYGNAFQQPTVLAIMAILAVYGTLTGVTWLYFRRRRSRGDDDTDDAGSSSLHEAMQEGSQATA